MKNLRPALSIADWVRLNRLLEQGLDLDEEARRAWLDQLTSETAHVRDALKELLGNAAERASRAERHTPAAIAMVASDALAAMRLDRAGQVIGPWRLERLLAEGGMGAVWLAERADGVMQRSAALKLPRAEWVDHGLTERIARERAILARLQHPNIAVLYDAGVTTEGRPYLALEYVEGEPIDAWCRARSVDVKQLLHLFVPVVRAVAYAHSRLIIHRDIKPGNVLITADGMPKLLDFGVSKLLAGENTAAEATALTRLSGRPLTLAYAAPEQVLGSQLTVAIDVYALGVVLFELLTGARLYRSTTPYALEQEITSAEIRRPSDVAVDRHRAQELRGDLDAIVLTALKRSPEQRYASAGAFADDLERYLAGEPVQAQPDSRMYRLRKFVARNRFPVAAAGAIALAIGTGLGMALWQANIAREQATEATALNTFVLSLIQRADPNASQQSRKADLATLAAIEERVDEFRGTASQKLRLLVGVGDAYRNRAEMSAAQRAYKRAADLAVGAVAPDDLHMLTAHVRLADPRLITSMDAVGRLDRAIDVLRSKADGADLLIDALLIRHELANEYGVPEFPPLARRFDLLGEALDTADRRFGKGSRHYLKALLPYAVLVAEAGDRANSRRLIEESLGEAQQRQDNVIASTEYREVETAHFANLCGAEHGSDGLHRLWRLFDTVRATHDDTSVHLETVYSALGLCYDRIGDATGYWVYPAAFEVAAARERPPSIQLMRRAHRAMTWALDWNDFEAAEYYYDKAVENFPTNIESVLGERLTRRVQLSRVCLLHYSGKADEAVKHAESMLATIGPDIPLSGNEIGARKCLSFSQRELGRYDDAARSAQALLDRCSGYSEVPYLLPCRNRGLMALAFARLDAGRADEATAILNERAKLPLRPTINPEMPLARARIDLEQGRPAEAVRRMQELYGYWLTTPKPRGPYAAEAEYWLGQAYLANGDKRGQWMVAEARRTLATSPLRSHRALAENRQPVAARQSTALAESKPR